MAVGNFKREGGRRLHPALLAAGLPLASKRRPSQFDMPGLAPQVKVSVEDRGSWCLLSDMLPGVGVAATTTLLASLWPDRHFVFDRRVCAAANGLRVHANLSACADIRKRSTASV